ncbi:YceI family protein [Pseudahrensia aquimaris]|uniref:YceI family protein n=1 Tax=Pseudahrensia aquimaris TaxID=744461 RepID=A0ABW3FB65_9HYPH
MKTLKASLAGLALMASAITMPAFAADQYKFDASHAQILFSYDHLGFSTTYGMFSGFDGTATLDMDNLANSSVETTIGLDKMITGWEGRDGHFKSPDFFNAAEFPAVTFKSTKIEPTGDMTAKMTGDLTILGETKPVTMDVKLNKIGEHPVKKVAWAGFDATTTLKRTEWGLGKFAPFVGDEVNLVISIELEKTN